MALTRPRARADTTAGSTTERGLGAARITVKGVRATAAQRRVIDGALAEAARLGASRRVMVAVVMAMTQESACQSLRHGDSAGPDSRGPFQQRAPWGSEAERLDPAASTRLFLTVDKGPGVRGWVATHGGIKVAPSNLSAAINEVQRSRYPNAYARWEEEATRTVETWLGGDAGGAQTTRGSQTTREYEFTRGERGGEPEDSWAATGRLAEEVGAHRWAAGNVLHWVSDDELRRQPASVRITGEEPWLLSEPAWDWSGRRPITEVQLKVASDRWGVMPGGVVELAMGNALDGRWIVAGVAGSRLDAPDVTVTLRRPTAKRPEPAAETTTSGGAETETDSVAAAQSPIYGACKRIHDARPAYDTDGDSHRRPISKDLQDDYDCSSAVSTALAFAGYGFAIGSQTLTSGGLESWGEPGKGRVFTVWANASHVWIELHGKPDGWARFDTSPHGDGERGPRLRRTSRGDASRFVPRHWQGQ